MKYEEENGTIYGYQRGQCSINGNPRLINICGRTPKLGMFVGGKSSPNAGWVYSMRYSMEGNVSPLNAMIRWHRTGKGNLVIDNIEVI